MRNYSQESLTGEELRTVYNLLTTNLKLEFREAKFLDSVVLKLKERGESNAYFSVKQRNWILNIGKKYMD